MPSPSTADPQQSSADAVLDNDKPTHIGGSVIPPKLLSGSEVKFPRSARKQKVNGSVSVYLWVGPDGVPSHVAIAKSLRPDLDELALQAVQKYRFEPATMYGKPVRVYLFVDVNINIY